jgi:membrane-bound ClpP family serine protease
MTDPYIIWALLLLGAGLVLFVIELFVPSGGLLGLCSAGCAVAGVVCLFKVNTTLGAVASLVILVAIPFLIGYSLKLLPHTPIWKWLTLKDVTRATTGVGRAAVSGPAPAPDSLVGAQGKAVTDLHPVGTCLINGRRTECLAVGSMIEAGTAVTVVSADGMQVKVRAEE